jgi:DNA-binding transcriptional ArsR family regulator
MAAAKAMADESRVRIILFLGGGELCLCQIIEMLGLAPSTVSKHMAVLYQARLVETRKEGRWIYYRLAGAGGSVCAREAIRWVRRSLDADPQARQDAKRVRTVKKADLADLCCRYRG